MGPGRCRGGRRAPRRLAGRAEGERPARARAHAPGARPPHVADVSPLLHDRPEFAGLFLLVDDPQTLSDRLRGPDGELLAGLFLAHLAPEDAAGLARALVPDGNAGLIADLVRKGMVGAEALFVFDRGTPAADAYDVWLRGVLRNALRRPDEDLATTVLFLAAEGPGLRRRMADRALRLDLPERWNRLRRGVEDRSAELLFLLELSGVWDFLARSDADALLRRRGALAVDLLSGDRRYPPHAHDRVARLLREGDYTVARMLLDCRGEAAFTPFLAAPLTTDDYRALAADLLERHRGDLKGRLKALQGKLALGPERLREALGPPPSGGVWEYVPLYSAYRVASKYLEGDEVDDADLLFAAVDVATLAVPAAKGAVTLGKAGALAGGKAAARQAVKDGVVALVRDRLKGEVGAVAITRSTVWAAAGAAYTKACQVVRSVLHGKEVPIHLRAVDVTGAVRYVFDRCGVGRATFKRLTGLEARLFMRQDARVVLKLHWRIEGREVRGWLADALLKVCGRWAEDYEFLPKGLLDAAREDPWKDWARAAGALWLASAADLLPK